jgi:hypothetical protein
MSAVQYVNKYFNPVLFLFSYNLFTCERTEGTRTFTDAPTSCDDCVPGRAAGSESATSCMICSAGYFAEKNRAVKCDACKYFQVPSINATLVKY